MTEHQASTATERQAPASSRPICLVVNPTASVWPEVSPLLTPPHHVHDVQVVLLLLGSSPPILPLRPLCHQLPVVEIAASRLTQPLLLPDTFRPANLPIPRPGQALAWMRGGSISWLGRAPALSTARHTTSFNQSHP